VAAVPAYIIIQPVLIIFKIRFIMLPVITYNQAFIFYMVKGLFGMTTVFDAGYYNKLFAYYAPDMPYGVAKARSGDPDEWILNRLEEDLGVYRRA
jgi:hypothetical protein